VRCRGGLGFQRQGQNPLNQIVTDAPWGARSWLVEQSIQPPMHKAFAPFSHGDVMNAKFGGDLLVRQSSVRSEDYTGAYR
jgi:hypothetical protein